MRALRECTVAVLYGGRSGEREVSLDTGQEVCRALEEAIGRRGEPARLLGVEWAADGGWLWPGGTAASLEDAVREIAADVYFLALHGGEGEDGRLQQRLERAGAIYTGSGVDASARCMDKWRSCDDATEMGLATARGWRIVRGETFEGAGVPSELVVKPRHGGSSVDTTVLSSPDELTPALERVFANGDDALVEERLRGLEVTCGVLGNRGEELRALTPVEIRPHEGRFFDYEEKYSETGAEELCPPIGLTGDEARTVQEAALRAHATLGCDGYSRTDFLWVDGRPVYLETNTLPGLTARSLLPQSAAVDGMEFPDLCCWILEAALRRAAQR